MPNETWPEELYTPCLRAMETESGITEAIQAGRAACSTNPNMQHMQPKDSSILNSVLELLEETKGLDLQGTQAEVREAFMIFLLTALIDYPEEGGNCQACSRKKIDDIFIIGGTRKDHKRAANCL